MQNLFIIYIGGSHEQSLIELHDIRFIAGNTIEDTYQEIAKSWWGKPKSLHIDAWGCLKYVDGYEISLHKNPPIDSENKLYFVNLGGYDSRQFTELHKNVFVVASNPGKAKVKALKQILDWESHHKDYLFEVDDIISMDKILEKQKIFIHLSKVAETLPFTFTCKYIPIKN